MELSSWILARVAACWVFAFFKLCEFIFFLPLFLWRLKLCLFRHFCLALKEIKKKKDKAAEDHGWKWKWMNREVPRTLECSFACVWLCRWSGVFRFGAFAVDDFCFCWMLVDAPGLWTKKTEPNVPCSLNCSLVFAKCFAWARIKRKI